MIYRPLPVDFTKWDEADRAIKLNQASLEVIDRTSKNNHKLLYRYISHPFADGYAYYQIIKENKITVKIRVCKGMGDDWVLPVWGEESTISKILAEQMIERRDHMEKLFKNKGVDNA